MTEPYDSAPPNRRSILGFAIIGLGAIFSAIIGIPIVCYVLDPRHRKGPKSAMKLVEGVNLGDLLQNTPVQGTIRDTRMDGWTLYPNDVIGRVWVVQLLPQRPANAGNQMDKAAKDAYLKVFTTICPHLGCSVNTGGPGFACPCHAATFNLDGKRANESNPAQRGMDTLEWEFDDADPDRIKVTFKKYQANNAHKIPLGGGAEEVPNA